MIPPRLLSPSLTRRFISRAFSAQKSTTPSRSRRPVLVTLFASACASAYYLYEQFTSPPKYLNPDYFTPYTLISHTPVSTSPTQTSILELVPQFPHPSSSPFSDEAIESIEIKQPSLQIARSYTPLPLAAGILPGTLRLIIKREPTGEMSRYLFSLAPGPSTVWVRGPHTEYCLPSHHSATVGPRLLFIAGGTGIAPALQAAQKLLGGDEKARMMILWGVRHGAEAAGQMGRECERLLDAYGERLELKVLPDGEGGISKGRVKEAVEGWGAERVVVSGPEGFIEFWAGAKQWVDGRETQGRIGGVLGVLLVGGRERTVRVWKL